MWCKGDDGAAGGTGGDNGVVPSGTRGWGTTWGAAGDIGATCGVVEGMGATCETGGGEPAGEIGRGGCLEGAMGLVSRRKSNLVVELEGGEEKGKFVLSKTTWRETRHLVM